MINRNQYLYRYHAHVLPISQVVNVTFSQQVGGNAEEITIENIQLRKTVQLQQCQLRITVGSVFVKKPPQEVYKGKCPCLHALTSTKIPKSQTI